MSMSTSALTLTSEDVAGGQTLPAAHVHVQAGGQNLSPQLSWSGSPAGTASFAVTCFDPDASAGGFWHWLVVDLPPSVDSLPRGASLPPEAVSPRNDFGQAGYGGAAPPRGHPHRYIFTVYALDVPSLGVSAMASTDEVEAALSAHTLASASITTTYQS